MKNHVRHVLRAWAELKHRKNLRAGINGQPEKDAPVRRCAAGCVVRPAGGEGAGDGRRSARAGCVRAHQHGTERLVIVACRKPKTRRASDESSPSASRDEHHGDLVRWGFQTVQGSVAPGSERAATGRASKCLNALSSAMFAISHQSVDSSISDAKVKALLVRTGEAFGIYALGSSPAAFHPTPGTRLP